MGIRKKPHGVLIKPLRKRIRPRHTGAAILKTHPKSSTAPPSAPTSTTAVIGDRELQLARALSDTDSQVRDAALLALQTWLASHGDQMSALDVDRLCKAVYYCVWMADGRLVITEVVNRVVGLGAGWVYLAGLVKCVVREWHGVDRHRVDKYYELVTKCVEACVEKAVSEGGNKEAVARLMAVLDGKVISQSSKGASGVALHVLDHWLERVVTPIMKCVQARKGVQENELVVVFESLMEPACSVLGAQSGTGMAVSRRSVERVVAGVPQAVREFGVGEKAQRDMCRRTMRKVWGAAADKKTIDVCRESLYEAHNEIKLHVKALEENVGVVPEKKLVVKMGGKKGRLAEDVAMETDENDASVVVDEDKMESAAAPTRRSARNARKPSRHNM